MNPIPVINQASAAWCAWAGSSLLDGTVACVLVWLFWLGFGRRLSPRVGAWLFALVLLKCLVAVPVSLPIPPGSMSSLSPDIPLAVTDDGSLLKSLVPGQHHRATQAGSLPGLTPASGIAIAWIFGALVGLARLVWLCLRTRRLIRKAEPAAVADVQSLRDLLDRAGCRGPLEVRLSAHLHSPAVTGCLRPVLLLPAGLSERLSPAQHRWVLAHELAHLRGGDVVWQWLELLVRTLLFFHPAVWLAAGQSARLRERACDEAALEISGSSRQASAEGFMALIEWSRHRPAVSLAGLGMGRAGREARSRIQALATGRLRPAASKWQAAFVVTVVSTVVPSFRAGQAQPAVANEGVRIVELEKRVAELEQQLRAKSRLEILRETAIQRSHQRAAADERRFTPEQLREIEALYQAAKKNSATAADLMAGFQPLLERYPAANRTGCALLLLARLCAGTERAQLLQRALTDHSDAYFLDGTSVGGVARLMLAQDAEAAGRPADAQRWRTEIQRQFAGELDFGAVPLVDILDREASK